MPTYPPPLADFSSSYWQLNTKIVTPTGTMEGAFMLQNQPDGSATLLWSTTPIQLDPVLHAPIPGTGGGIMRGNADRAQMGLDGSPSGTGLPRTGFGSPYQPANFAPFSGLTQANSDPGQVIAPCHLIGINLGIRKGGYLGCNVSIGYFAENAKPMAGFWQQDISYYRQWNYINTPPPVYFWTTSLPNPLPSALDGWTYIVGPPFFFSGDGKFYNAAVPFPTAYKPVTPVRYGGGSPVYASNSSTGSGQLFQEVLPTSADAMPDPRSGTVLYQEAMEGWDTQVASLERYANEWAFVGDIFPTPPCFPLFDGAFWLVQKPWTNWGGAVFPAEAPGVGLLSHISSSLYLNGRITAYNTIVATNPLTVSPPSPTPFICETGIPLGLGCTLYYLTACKIPATILSPPPPPPPPCNIKVVQTTYANSGHPVTTATCTLNDTVTAGNTILVIVRGENNQPITLSDNQGNSYTPDVQQDNQSDYILSAWRTTAHASGFLTLTVNTPPTLPAGGPIGFTIDLMEVSGLAASGPVLTAYQTGLSGNVNLVAQDAVGDKCDLLVASYIADTSTQTYPDSPWATLESSRLDPTGDTVWQETHGLVIGPSAYWTLQAAVPWTAIMVAYKTS